MGKDNMRRHEGWYDKERIDAMILDKERGDKMGREIC